MTTTAGMPKMPVAMVVSQLMGISTPGIRLSSQSTTPPIRAFRSSFQMILKLTLLAFLGCVKTAQAFLELFEDWTGRI